MNTLLVRDFYVFRNQAYNTYFESFNLSKKFQYYGNKTFSYEWDKYRLKMSYSHGIEIFEKDWMTQNVFYTSDFQTHKNLSHKQSVLFIGHHRIPISRSRKYGNILPAFLKRKSIRSMLAHSGIKMAHSDNRLLLIAHRAISENL